MGVNILAELFKFIGWLGEERFAADCHALCCVVDHFLVVWKHLCSTLATIARQFLQCINCMDKQSSFLFSFHIEHLKSSSFAEVSLLSQA